MKKLIFTSLLLLSACSSQQTQDPGYGGGSQYDESRERESARVHTELGAGYYSQGQLAVALEEYGVATRMDSSYGPAFNGLGLVYSALRDDAKAEANFQKSLQLEPQNSDSRNNYGTFLCSRNRIDESIVQFMEAVKNPLYTTPAQAYMNAGVCSLRKRMNIMPRFTLKRLCKFSPCYILLLTSWHDSSIVRGNTNRRAIPCNMRC